MEYKTLYQYDPAILHQAALMHHKALAGNSLITTFGAGFLMEFYKCLFKDHVGFLVYAEDKEKLAGFILGAHHSQKVMGIVKKRWIVFLPYVLKSVFLNPRIIGKLIEPFSYFKKEGNALQAELVVIAVDEIIRSKGIGSTLVALFEKELKKSRILEYQVNVHQDMQRANHFYQKQGMTVAATFNFLNVPWNSYLRKIPQ